MASEELVTEQFQFLGIEVQKEVLSKCVILCEEHDVDAETFIELWMAFSLNHLSGAPPSIENLDLLVRKEFSKRAANRINASATEAARPSTGSSLTVYGAPVSDPPENEVLSNYMVASPTKRLKVEADNGPVHHGELLPATYSPTVGHSAKYASRTNRGAVLLSYGEERLLGILSEPNAPDEALDLNITLVPNDDGDLYTNSMFGFELLHEKAAALDDHIRFLSQCILEKAGITDAASVRHKTQSEVCVCGRVECDADARLNAKCVVLQGAWEQSLSQAVPFDLDNLQQYSLFPGQVVAVRGANPRGSRLAARAVLSDAAPPPPPPLAGDGGARGISMVIAAGPYTTSDNMAYEPLKDLVQYVAAHKPRVVIMTGPFMDCDHARVKDHSLAETYSSFFDKLVDSLGELAGPSPSTQVYVVASSRDAFHVNVYPTPAYASRRRPAHVHFVPDPSTLRVGALLVGVTSTDVLMHLSQEEISCGAGGDKLARLARHLLAQRSYYPLWPPTALAADAALWAAHAQLPATPHVLVLPSNFRYFVKEVEGCVVLNPERLAKGAGGGTLARLLLGGGGVAAQIVRI